MGMAAIAHALWSQFLNHSPSNPKWYNRDRFVLSNGHACALLYTLLHLSGYPDFPMEEILRFRQLGSKTPGHPESHFGGGVEVTTGPLGQGFSNAVGLAIAQAHLAATYNREGFELFSNYTYVFCGDGCMMEGITSEAASLAGHLGLSKLIVLYDDNKISIDGPTSLAFTENVAQRFESYGWNTLYVDNATTDHEAVARAIQQAKQSQDKPTLIVARTTIGFGSAKQGTEKTHGSPLGDDDIVRVKNLFGFDPEKKLYIPDEVYSRYRALKEQGDQKAQAWEELFSRYAQAFPQEHGEIVRRFSGKLPEGWINHLPRYKPGDKELATRQCSQQCLEAVFSALPELMGGSADLTPSNLTLVGKTQDFQKDCHQGRNIRFGVREHAMVAIVNGLAAFGGFLPYGATFLNFLSYCHGAVTLSALSRLRIFLVMTHDSIGLGEDGPTHQPIEKIATVRALPNILLLRPADGNETSGAYAVCFEQTDRPSVLALSRQNLPQLEGTSIEGVRRGAYILSGEGAADVILVATGSEVSLIVKAKELLSDLRVRIVSMPSWELFDEQPREYALSVFPDGVPVLSVEAAATFGWARYAHASLGIDSAGASGKYNEVYRSFGLYPENIAEKARTLVKLFANNPPQSRVHFLTF